ALTDVADAAGTGVSDVRRDVDVDAGRRRQGHLTGRRVQFPRSVRGDGGHDARADDGPERKGRSREAARRASTGADQVVAAIGVLDAAPRRLVETDTPLRRPEGAVLEVRPCARRERPDGAVAGRGVESEAPPRSDLRRRIVFAVPAAEIRAPGAEVADLVAARCGVEDRAGKRRRRRRVELRPAARRGAGRRRERDARTGDDRARNTERPAPGEIDGIGAARPDERDRARRERALRGVPDLVAREMCLGILDRFPVDARRYADAVRPQHASRPVFELVDDGDAALVGGARANAVAGVLVRCERGGPAGLAGGTAQAQRAEYGRVDVAEDVVDVER